MAISVNKKNPEEEKLNSKEMPAPIVQEALGEQAAPEALGEREAIHQEVENNQVRQQLEKMDLDDSLKGEAQAKADQLQGLGIQQAVQKLLHEVETKGVIFAVHTAKKMDDPYILDVFHDALIKGGHYKQFLK